MTIFTDAEIEDVKTRVERVTSLVRNASQNWIDVGNEFANAKAFLNIHVFERFINDAGFTTSVADKLVCIGKCSALRQESAKPFIACIDGWTTLYEVTKLDESQLKDLWSQLEQNPHQRLSRAVIQSVARGSTVGDRSIILGVIEVTANDLDGMTAAQIADLRSRLENVQRVVDAATAGVKFAQRKNAIKLLDDAANANGVPELIQTAA